MNHRNGVKKLGRDRAHHRAILNNLALSFFKYEKIKTTKLKAKVLRSFVEKIITRSKVDDLHNRRLVYRNVRDTKIIKKIFEDIGKRFQNRNGGYTRIYQIGQRKGDGADICYLELVEELLTTKSDSDDKKSTDVNKNESVDKQVVFDDKKVEFQESREAIKETSKKKVITKSSDENLEKNKTDVNDSVLESTSSQQIKKIEKDESVIEENKK